MLGDHVVTVCHQSQSILLEEGIAIRVEKVGLVLIDQHQRMPDAVCDRTGRRNLLADSLIMAPWLKENAVTGILQN